MGAIVTLTTDFGTRDSYAAEMKGTILALAPDACLVDVTHEVPPHDVAAAARVLERAVPAFPAGTVHVAVVDPGVGTRRRGPAVCAAGQALVGPDNGVFTPFLAGTGWEAFELPTRAPERGAPGRTFHGRDVFAPIAARLALGLEARRLGPPVVDPVRLPWPAARWKGSAVEGTVVHVDRFGNLVTSIPAAVLGGLGPGVLVEIAGRALRLVGTYGDLARGAAGALIGSDGRLEVAVREGSAARRLRARAGTRVVVSRTSGRARARGPGSVRAAPASRRRR